MAISPDGAQKLLAALRAEYVFDQGPTVGQLINGAWGGGLHPSDIAMISPRLNEWENRVRHSPNKEMEINRIGMEIGQPAGYPAQPGYPPMQPGAYPPMQPGAYPPMQPGGYPPMQPSGYPPMQPGGYPPMQPGGFPPMQPGAYPSQAPLLPGGVYPIQAPMQQGMLTHSAGALQALAHCTCVEVKEKANAIEAITAFIGAEIEMANKYRVLDPSGREIMFAVERTDFCRRQMKQCCSDCTSWEVDLHYTATGQAQEAFKLERPCSLTCCCINRPEMTVTDATTHEVVGKMRDPFACCDLTFSLQDPAGGDVLYAKGGCCQWGLCCPLPCGPCAEVKFPVSDARSGNQVGHIEKRVPSCLKCLFAGDVDNYKVDFGGVENPQYKVLLVAMAIFMDFRYFNDNKNDNRY